MDSLYINLTYRSPCEDLEDSIGFNPDGSINISYTIVSIRNLLEQNINILNELLSETENITNIILNNNGKIEIKLKSLVVIQKLIDKDIIVKNLYLDENIIDNIDSSDEESNNTRFEMINNLTSQNDSQYIFNRKSESEYSSDSSSDSIINDVTNQKSIIDKYKTFISSLSDSGDESKSDKDSDDEFN